MRIKGSIGAVLAAAVAAGGLAAMGARPASATPASLTITGHGWGHGRGMGQYGALGYAQSGWSYQQILAHYYGGTALATTSVAAIPVSLSELYGSSSVPVAAPSGHTLLLDGHDTTKPSLTLTRGHSVTASGGADVVVTGPWSTGSTRMFAGTVALPAGIPNVVNTVTLVQYVEGVVPQESPASWPQATLEAQAVAARSYALAYTANGTQTICDYAACQMYGGDPAQYPNSYSSNSNSAVTATGREVLVCASGSPCGAAGQVAFTEFSSSTGGWTAGGRFPAVADAGDATSSNPNHDWTTTLPASTVEEAFPAVGTLQSVTVTSRNGYGDMGGRVLSMVLSGTRGRVTVTGDEFAGAVGLRSDWFSVTSATPPPGSDTGYWVVAADGSVYPFGSAPSYGSMAGHTLSAPVIGMAPTGDGSGYWLVGGDGGIFSFGDARFYGSTGGAHLVAPVIGMASTPDSRGYWMEASDGGVFSFGDARFFGSTGGVHLAKPVVALARTHSGQGYWMVASDGGVFSFGDARFYGSTAGVRLAAPIVGMVPTSDGKGYWLVASDGGVFAFGDAGFVGSLGGQGVRDVASVSPTPDGKGYLLVTGAGQVYTFGDATFLGDPSSTVSGWSGTAIGVFTR
ncbi:MAG TPA: SpoIID/LytB domain-containing protein [Acidimicrobiales bacterium]|nr:SpoIID/LytB domain-containing protein [Acidimicrobiales bacterium]